MPRPRVLRVDLRRVDLGADQALGAAPHNVGGHALRPVGGVLAHVLILGRLQGVHRPQLVHGQVARAAAQGLVAGGVQETRRAHPLRDVFLVVPGIEFGVVLNVNVGVHHQQCRAFIS